MICKFYSQQSNENFEKYVPRELLVRIFSTII